MRINRTGTRAGSPGQAALNSCPCLMGRVTAAQLKRNSPTRVPVPRAETRRLLQAEHDSSGRTPGSACWPGGWAQGCRLRCGTALMLWVLALPFPSPGTAQLSRHPRPGSQRPPLQTSGCFFTSSSTDSEPAELDPVPTSTAGEAKEPLCSRPRAT